MSTQARPAASSMPRRWLRDSGEAHVARMSPMPASPAKVNGLAPAATPRRVISGEAPGHDGGLAVVAQAERVGGTAAMATMFLSAPASSTPTRSRLR